MLPDPTCGEQFFSFFRKTKAHRNQVGGSLGWEFGMILHGKMEWVEKSVLGKTEAYVQPPQSEYTGGVVEKMPPTPLKS